MSSVETIAQSFATYRDQVLPKDAPPIQIEECRRAFYAGSYFMLMNVAYHIGDESTSEEDGIEQLERLKAECEVFAATVGQPVRPTALRVSAVNPEINYTTPDPDDIRPLLNDLGHRIGDALPSGYGFNLQIFQFGAGGNLFYISNANREDVFQMMREFMNRQTQ